jgi:uncharacterized protein (TIGR03083 family)
MVAATVEYDRLLTLLRSLDVADWDRPTDCSEWDVRQMVAHLVGAAESTARIRELVRQARSGRRLRPGEPTVDGMNAVQVAERADAPAADLVADLERAGAAGVRTRRRIPAALRAVPVPFGPPLGVRRLGYLTDRIYTRDAWMHRIDLAAATGRDLVVTADHDGALVADVVEEWAGRHDLPYRLVLTGPAGGTWRRGPAGAVDGDRDLELGALEFVRLLSGRGHGAGLLALTVPF